MRGIVSCSLFFKFHELNGFELNGSGLGLDGDVAGGEGGAVIELDVVVFADDFSIGDVLEFVAADFDFYGDPFVAVDGGTAGFDDVGFGGFALPVELGAGGADVQGAALAFAEAAEELDFDRVGEFLILLDRFRILAVEHEPVVPLGPAGAAFDLLADEAVGGADLVVGVGSFVEEVAELAAELVPF